MNTLESAPAQQVDLTSRLNSYPRIPLAQYPSPLEELPRLAKELGRQIYVKRDDQIGPGMGGNKTRKLEYLLGEAHQRRARKVATFGGLQSNHARLTAAAARKLGLDVHLFYFERRPHRLEGNLLLNSLLGAKLHFIPLGGGGGMTIETSIRLAHAAALAVIGPHYFIPVGGHSVTGCLGYVNAAFELDAQAREAGIENAWLVVPVGSGGTLAGLMAGLALCGSPLRLVGIDVGKLWKAFPVSITRLARELCTCLDRPTAFSPAQTPIVERVYVGRSYATPTPACQAAIRRLACLEGLILDPVYTGKAFAGLLDLAESGKLGQDEPLIFLHTGGAPALFSDSQWQAGSDR
jgi:D-cysteine desulfhydrase family pyridoxal phosphate-dependent enzyme